MFLWLSNKKGTDDKKKNLKIICGKHEFNKKDFKKKSKKYNSVQDINFSKVLPDDIKKGKSIPKYIRKYITEEFDELFTAESGCYYVDNKSVLHVGFKKLPAAAAKIKVNHVIEQIKGDIENKDRVDKNKDNSGEKATKKISEASENFLKIVKQGLKVNPSAEQFSIWISRVLQNFIHASNSMLPSELVDMLDKSDIYYRPICKLGSKKIIANYSLISVPEKSRGEPEMMRRELVQLTAACVEMCKYAQKGKFVKIMTSISAGMIKDKDARLLIKLMMKRMASIARQSIIIELKSVSGKAFSEDALEDMLIISNSCYEMSCKADFFSPSVCNLGDVKISSYNMDVSAPGISSDSIPDRMDNVADIFSLADAKINFGGVNSKDVYDIMLASNNGYNVSGNFLGTPIKEAKL